MKRSLQSSVGNQYGQSKNLSKYKQLAQKLAEHLQKLQQDQYSMYRWIWQLIQNAKDVPNRFGKTKIKILIKDQSLQFLHNGDEFRTSDLQSIVNQYSSKKQKTQDGQDTTGRYGTGFITTYLLSRRLTISGIIKSSPKVNEQNNWFSEQEDQQQIQQEEQQEKEDNQQEEQLKESKVRKNIKPNQSQEQYNIYSIARRRLWSQESHNIEKIKSIKQRDQDQKYNSQHLFEMISQNSQIKKQKRNNAIMQTVINNKTNPITFQKFTIGLDRDYKNRQQFYKKLMKNEQKVENHLKNQLIPKQPWQRNQDSFDTIFSYQKINQQGFKLISKGIKSIKQLFPYALLFNKKLYEIDVRDQRKKREFKDFIIRKDQISKENVFIFNCKFIQIDSQNIKEQLIKIAFQQDQQSQSLIAVPIEIKDSVLHIKQIPQKTPKIFKQFPLFGSQLIGYNYIFTSKKMYPNESRSTLQLDNNFQGKKSEKVEKNWKVLDLIFKKAISFFSFLQIFVKGSVQNFLNLKFQGYLRHQNKEFLNEFERFQNNIMRFQIFQDQKGKKQSLKSLSFMNFSYKFSFETMSQSLQMNEMFSFLFPQKNFPSKETYQKIHKKLCLYDSWPVNTLSLKNCIENLSKLTYEQFISKFGNQNQAQQKINDIYNFLLINDLSYLNYDKSDQKTYKIFLTERRQFNHPKNLKIQGNIDPSYLNLLQQVQLMENFKQILIDKQYQKYFIDDRLIKIPALTHQFIINQIIKKFCIQKLSNNQQTFILFLKLIQTFQLCQELVHLIKQLKKYSKIQPFQESFKCIKLTDQEKQNMIQRINKSFYNKINKMLEQQTKQLNQLKDLIKILNNESKIQTEDFAINWFDNLLKIQANNKHQFIKFNISQDKKFKKLSELKRVQKNEIQKEDITFYNTIKLEKQKYQANNTYSYLNNTLKQKPSIQSFLLHNKVTFQTGIEKTSYKKEFEQYINFYEHLSNQGKKQYHVYVQKLMKLNNENNNEHYKKKIVQFQKFLDKRNIEYLTLNDSLFSKEQKNIIYDLISNKNELDIIKQLKKKQTLDNIKTIIDNQFK